MAKCECCGNEYDKTFTVELAGKRHVFDCFECAAHTLAPTCARCGCKILGHGLENGSAMYCCASCAKLGGETRLRDRV